MPMDYYETNRLLGQFLGLVPFSVRPFRADAAGWHGQSSARQGRTLPVLACPQELPRAGSARTSLPLRHATQLKPRNSVTENGTS